jgi:hypothetical protein
MGKKSIIRIAILGTILLLIYVWFLAILTVLKKRTPAVGVPVGIVVHGVCKG